MLADFILYLIDYSFDDNILKLIKKQNVIIFPHTTKMETFIVCLIVLKTWSFNKFCFCVTEEYMRIPILGNILSLFGAVTVKNGSGMTSSSIEFLKNNKDKSLAISPEGSLSPREWKKGFFYIAQGADIPISVAGICFVDHMLKCDESRNIHIKPSDTYDLKINEILKVFEECDIIPMFPENSNPRIKTNKLKKPSYLSNRAKFRIFCFTTLSLSLIFLRAAR